MIERISCRARGAALTAQIGAQIVGQTVGQFAAIARRIMREAGAEATFAITSPRLEGDHASRAGASISRHIMGTCRMGDDPRTSVVDRWQRFHDIENMVCTDSSVFPTSTGYGPTLTIVALAIRACRALAGLPVLRSERKHSG